MVTFREFLTAFRKLEIERNRPVIVHSSLSAFGQVQGGADTILGALLGSFNTVVVPTFTYKTMIVPETGPEGNACVYGSGRDSNRMAEFFQPDMPADRLMGIIPETLRKRPTARRSSHPILSFAGINADAILEAQTLEEPLEPINRLKADRGWVLLLGVDHTVNTSIHYAERVAGRKQFVRWSLTSKGVVECPGFPGDSAGFQAISTRLGEVARQVQVGPAPIIAIPLLDLIDIACRWVSEDPLALLCSLPDCERCVAVRQGVSSKHPKGL